MTRRTDRINGLLRQEIGSLLLHGLRDPRLVCLTSVTRVRSSVDLRHAQVFVSVMGSPEEKQEVMRGLDSAAPLLRRELMGRVVFRPVPELRFTLDDSIEEGERVLKLLDRLSYEKRQEDS